MINFLAIVFAEWVIWAMVLWLAYELWNLTSKERLRWFFCAIILVIITLSISVIADMSYYNPRPFVVEKITPLVPSGTDNGFPSGHTLYSALIGVSLLFVKPVQARGLIFVSVIVGFSRVYANVHHAVDIIASLVIVTIAFVLTNILFRRFSKTFTYSL